MEPLDLDPQHTQDNLQMLEPGCTVLLNILYLERRLLDVNVQFLAEHCDDLVRAAGGRNHIQIHGARANHYSWASLIPSKATQQLPSNSHMKLRGI